MCRGWGKQVTNEHDLMFSTLVKYILQILFQLQLRYNITLLSGVQHSDFPFMYLMKRSAWQAWHPPDTTPSRHIITDYTP